MTGKVKKEYGFLKITIYYHQFITSEMPFGLSSRPSVV